MLRPFTFCLLDCLPRSLSAAIGLCERLKPTYTIQYELYNSPTRTPMIRLWTIAVINATRMVLYSFMSLLTCLSSLLNQSVGNLLIHKGFANLQFQGWNSIDPALRGCPEQNVSDAGHCRFRTKQLVKNRFSTRPGIFPIWDAPRLCRTFG